MKRQTKLDLNRAAALLTLVACDLAEVDEAALSRETEAMAIKLHAIYEDLTDKEWGT